MKIYNTHERWFKAAPDQVGGLVDTLAGPGDKLWPQNDWPPMKFNKSLGPGAQGGHGPVRYTVSEYVQGRRVEFRFSESGLVGGLDGRHLFEVVERRKGSVLRHIVDAHCGVMDWLKWQVIVRPMHNALLEDSLDLAEKTLHGSVSKPARWNLWTRILRRMASRRGGRPSD